MEPPPEESDALPAQVPATLAGVVDVEVDGDVVAPPPPLQPAVTSASPRTTPAKTPDIRVWFMSNWADSSMAELRGVERTAPL